MRCLSLRSTLALLLSSLILAVQLSGCAGSGDDKKETKDDDEAVIDAAAKKTSEGQAPAAPGAARSLDEVEKAFDARKEAFRRVNSARLSQNAGTFNVTMTFAPTGEVVECRMLSTDFREDPAFNAAVMAEVWRVRLPPRADVGEFVVASYPIVFSARSEAVATPPSMPIVSPPPPPPTSVPVPASPHP